MDTLDTRILGELRRNARAPLSTLAARLGVSRATVRARMARLEASGEIAGYTVQTKADTREAAVRAITLLAVEGKAIDRVAHALMGLGEVRAVHTTNGRWDLIVDLAADTLPHFDAALARIRQIAGVSATETSLLLTTRDTGRPSAARRRSL